MAKQPGSPDQIEAFANRLTEACIKACKAEGTIGHAFASVNLVGDYAIDKDGSLTVDFDLGADVPDEVPVEADVGTDVGRKYKKKGTGTLTVTYKVTVKTKEAR